MALQRGRVWLGQGIKYPVEINATGGIALENDILLVRQSLQRLLQTETNTVFYAEEYGTDLQDALFQQNDEVVKSLAQTLIQESVDIWENRIDTLDIEIQRGDTKGDNTFELLEIVINFTVINVAEQFAFVYPFYRQLIY